MKLDKKTLNFLKEYGFSINGSCEVYGEIREYLKQHYPEEYYLYVDLEVRHKAMNEANKLREKDYENMNLYYKAWSKKFKNERKNIVRGMGL